MTEPTKPDAKDSTPKSSWRRRLFGACLLLGLLVFLLPWLIAATSLRDRVLGRVVGDDWSVSCRSASFGWISPVTIQGLQLKSEDGTTELTVDEFSAEQTWWSLAFGKGQFGEFTIARPQLVVKATEDLKESSPRDVEGQAPTWTARIIDASVKIQGPEDSQDPAIEAEGIDLTVRSVLDGEAQLLLIEDWTILDREALTPDIVERGFQYVAPELKGEVAVEGAVSLRLDKLSLPLDAADDQFVAQLQLQGTAQLHTLTARVQNPMLGRLLALFAELMDLGPVPEETRLSDENRIEFEVREGRIRHTSHTLLIPDIAKDFQVQSSGSIGLDESLDLLVTARVPLALLGEGPLAEKVSQTPLEIAVTGTIAEPVLELPATAMWVSTLENEIESALASGERELANDLSRFIEQLRP